MSKITVRIEDYNELDLVARARLTVHDTVFDARTAQIKDLALAKKKKKEALDYINNSAALVKAASLNKVYETLGVLAHETECLAEIRNHTSMKKLRDAIIKISFGFTWVFAELTNLMDEEKGGFDVLSD